MSAERGARRRPAVDSVPLPSPNFTRHNGTTAGARRAAYVALQHLADALSHYDTGDDTRAERSIVAAAGILAPIVDGLEQEGSI